MGQVVQVNGDYEIKALSNSTTPGVFGKITLNTGDGLGEVRVTGNLVVDGTTLTVSAENLQVQDNIILLNFPEAAGAAGVTLTYSGIEVERGTLPRAAFIFDETIDAWTIAQGTEGNYRFRDPLEDENSTSTYSRLKVCEIFSDPGTNNGDLILIGSGSGVISVKGTDEYELKVTEDDDIPNKKYVDDAIQNSPTFQIRSDNTRVVIRDADTTPNDAETGGSLRFWADITGQSPFAVTESAVGLLVDGSIAAEFYQTRAEIFGLAIFSEDPTNPEDIGIPSTVVLQAIGSAGNIKLETTDTGKVEFTYALQMNHVTTSDPGSVLGATVLYGKSLGAGGTGLYFTDPRDRNDELISKSKALLLSMIF
jgi:archaellum component FlaG (FlaF/FlaG flagellin family)